LDLARGYFKFFAGAAVGATFGFAAGSFAVSAGARSASQSMSLGLGTAARFLGKTTARAMDGIGSVLEDGYTRVRGREAYLEHEIESLRRQITRLEQKIE
jgi:hypothetical protein